MKTAKQFSLFVPHDAPIVAQPEPEKIEQTEEPAVEIAKPKNKISLYSDAAAKLLSKKNTSNNQKSAASLYSLEFNLDSCRACGSTRLVKYNNVYVCRTCGSENSIGGVLFGDKLKKGEKA